MALAAITPDRTLAIVMAVGMLAVFVLLAILVWTRWGQAKPISKCVVLSLLAHVLLLIYAYSTHVLYGAPGRWTGQTVKVRLHDAVDDEEAAPRMLPEAPPWEQSGVDEGPIASAPREKKDSHEQSAVVPPALLPDKPVEAESAERVTADVVQAEAPPPEAPPHASLQESVPSELIHSQPDAPRLTDLLPDREVTAAQGDALDAAPPMDDSPRWEDRALVRDLVVESLPVATTSAGPRRRLGDGRDLPEALAARMAADRLSAAQPFGATARTEAAVAAALAWLASVQSADGRWDADAYGAGRETRTLGHDRRGAGGQADTGVSGLALLAFLGSGQTHLEGTYRETVQHGFEFLLASQAASGSLAGNAEFFAAMYCHGIATLALAEAYALTGDERLVGGLRRAVQYTVQSQHSGGGWRYQPLDEGDMSQFGWQLMALKSAEMGGMQIPPSTRTRMEGFLQRCSSGRQRGLAAYRPGDRASRTMTAEAMVCRYFLAAENAKRTLDEAAGFIMEEKPGAGPTNFYYWYYGTLAIFQRQGSDWMSWNGSLTQTLLSRQRWDGAVAGSWDPDEVWGGYGGRIYSTALGALCLEVYYRYLPLYGRDTEESRWTERQWLPAAPR